MNDEKYPASESIGQITNSLLTPESVNVNDNLQANKSHYGHKRTMGYLTFLGLIAFVSVWMLNYFNLQQPMDEVLKSDPRNDGIKVSVHYSSYVYSSILVYDLNKIAGHKSPSDVFRVFVQFAHRVQDRIFDKVILAHTGKSKFYIEGEYYQQLGREYGSKNPVYTIRTFAEKLRTMDGKAAYGEWVGGLLGVLGHQMDDFTEFHKKWYIDDIAAQ